MRQHTFYSPDEIKGAHIKPLKTIPIKGKSKIELYPTYMIAFVSYGSNKIEGHEISYGKIACYEVPPLLGPYYYKLLSHSLSSFISFDTGCDLFAEIEATVGVHIPSLEEYITQTYGPKGALLHKTEKTGSMTFSTLEIYENYICYDAPIMRSVIRWENVVGLIVEPYLQGQFIVNFLYQCAENSFSTCRETLKDEKTMRAFLNLAKKHILKARTEFFLVENSVGEVIRRPLAKKEKCDGTRILVGAGDGEITDVVLYNEYFSLNAYFLATDLRKPPHLDVPYHTVNSLSIVKDRAYSFFDMYEIKVISTQSPVELQIRVSGEHAKDIATEIFALLKAKVTAFSPKAKIKEGKL